MGFRGLFPNGLEPACLAREHRLCSGDMPGMFELTGFDGGGLAIPSFHLSPVSHKHGILGQDVLGRGRLRGQT